jgi:hypothetical protein
MGESLSKETLPQNPYRYNWQQEQAAASAAMLVAIPAGGRGPRKNSGAATE